MVPKWAVIIIDSTRRKGRNRNQPWESSFSPFPLSPLIAHDVAISSPHVAGDTCCFNYSSVRAGFVERVTGRASFNPLFQLGTTTRGDLVSLKWTKEEDCLELVCATWTWQLNDWTYFYATITLIDVASVDRFLAFKSKLVHCLVWWDFYYLMIL